jgi:predicted nucleotidyltransferase
MQSIDTKLESSHKSGHWELDIIFGSSTRVKVLWAFISNPETFFGPRDLERICKRSYEDVRRVTSQLYTLGLIRARLTGTNEPSEQQSTIIHHPFCLNKNHPWIKPLRVLLERELGIVKAVEEKLNELGDISVAFIFGSFARGEQRPESDVDLVVIGGHTLETLVEPISEVEERINREVQLFTYTPREWRRKVKARDHFVVSMMETEKVFLVGSDERLAGITS